MDACKFCLLPKTQESSGNVFLFRKCVTMGKRRLGVSITTSIRAKCLLHSNLYFISQNEATFEYLPCCRRLYSVIETVTKDLVKTGRAGSSSGCSRRPCYFVILNNDSQYWFYEMVIRSCTTTGPTNLEYNDDSSF